MDPWKILEEREVYRNKHWLTVYEQRVELPNGHVIPDYLITKAPEVAMVFPLTESGEVVLVEQYKHGIRKPALDLPAGYIDEGESPEAAAPRELEEETGYVTPDWRPLGSYFYSENRHASRFHYFLARNVRPDGSQHFDETEELEVHRVPIDALEGLIEAERIHGLHSVAGIYRALAVLSRDAGC